PVCKLRAQAAAFGTRAATTQSNSAGPHCLELREGLFECLVHIKSPACPTVRAAPMAGWTNTPISMGTSRKGMRLRLLEQKKRRVLKTDAASASRRARAATLAPKAHLAAVSHQTHELLATTTAQARSPAERTAANAKAAQALA
ncbi:MAG: hypothetical protein SGPRY_011073, partial [Prymnesium sp.]